MRRVSQAAISAYAEIANMLDIPGALGKLSRNDLLTPRSDDKAGGQVAERFVESLKHQLQVGLYEPSRAQFVQVPKPGYATRPAALLSLADRVVYDALVDPLRARVEKSLVSSDTLLWPRANLSPKRWREFESLPLEADKSHILLGDITGFYESVDHELLKYTLVELTGRVGIVEALMDFLQQVMGSPRGLPQGAVASDMLATAHICSADAEMLREFPEYLRHGDDIRVAVDSHSDGMRAARLFEESLRSGHLILNSAKTRVIRITTYVAQQLAVDQHRENVVSRIKEAARARVSESDIGAIEQEFANIDGVVVRWITTWYEPEIDLEDLAEQIAEKLDPAETEIAEAMFDEAVRNAPGSGSSTPLSTEDFHSILASAMPVLLAARSLAPIGSTVRVLHDFPDKTSLFANYLRAVALESPEEVSVAALLALDESYLTGYQIAELLTPLRIVARASGVEPSTRAKIEERALQIASDEDLSFFERVESLRVLAELGQLDRATFRRVWNRAPIVLQADLVAAAVVAARDDAATWAHAFRDSQKASAIMQVVVSNVANLRTASI